MQMYIELVFAKTLNPHFLFPQGGSPVQMVGHIILIAAALGAGLMNSVAGGGSFLTFPALVFTGVPSIIANATSTVALFPGALASAWAYRQDFKTLENLTPKHALAFSLAGGMAAAL